MPELKYTPLNLIDNDSYLIIVYKDFDNIIVDTYSDKKTEDLKQTLNASASISKTNNGQKLLKLLSAGVTSSLAQSMISKSPLSNSTQGRIQSSLYDIIADGKISKTEVAEDFIGSCTNELDSTAIAMGFPTPQALYQAIGPDGAGVISEDFVKHFQKKAEVVQGEKLAEKNKVAQDLTTLKFKLVSGDSESWNSNIPTRKTEKGFDIADAIENENKTRDFQVSIIQGDYSGITDMYQVKNLIDTEIRDKKIPFDIYVNDKNNKKQEVWKHCFFTGVTWDSEGINCLNASLSITKIPEYEIKTTTVTGGSGGSSSSGKVRKQKTGKRTKTNYNKTNTIKKKSNLKASIGTPTTLAAINSVKDLVSQKNSAYTEPSGKVKLNVVQSKLKMLGVTTSPASLGINKYGATSKRY